jgi:mycothiol system anti-sigma-R factor
MSRPDAIRCEEVLKHLFAYLDGELEADSHAEIERHLEECRGCYSRAEFERLLKKRVAELGQEKAPAALRQRVRALLDFF